MASRKKSNPRKRTSKSPALRAASLAAPAAVPAPPPTPAAELRPERRSDDSAPVSFEPTGEELLWDDELLPVADRPFVENAWSLRASSEQHAGDLSSGGGQRQAVPLEAPKVPIDDLPVNYEDDRVVLLVRDPETLYAYWDFAEATADDAGAHRPFATTHLRVHTLDRGQPEVVREVEVDLGWKGYYLYDCRPGSTYRVELLVRDADGRETMLGTVSDVKRLPAATPSARLEDLFVAVAPNEPLPVEEPRVVREPAGAARPLHQRAYELSGGLLPPPEAVVIPPVHTGDAASSAQRVLVPSPTPGPGPQGFLRALLSGRTRRRGGPVAGGPASIGGEAGGAGGGEAAGGTRSLLRGGASDRGWSGTVVRR